MSRRPGARGLAGCFYIGASLLVFAGAGIASASHASETRALIATGLGGNPDYEMEFQRHANRLANRLREVSEDVTLLIGDTAETEAVVEALDAIKARLKSDDTLLFAYVGHGSYDGERFKFNVPGRDFTATDLEGWLASATANNQIVIVTGASSGAVQEVLASDERTVITGTRSGDQRNATVFGRFFTAALEDDAADVNKDNRITAIEAFRYAETGIERYYSGEGEMTTENPIASGPEPVMVLALLETQPDQNPELDHLYAERDALELEIANLRENKDAFTLDEYFAQLQEVLLDLAILQNEIELAETPAEGEVNDELDNAGETQ